MMELYKNIRNRRNELDITQSELATRIGYADKSMIAKIEKGQVDLTQSKIEAFAVALNTTPAYLMGWEEVKSPRRRGVSIPVYGRVAAGIPIEAIEDIIDTEEITEELATTGEFFGLKIKGNSMEPKISDGDVVIVRRQEDANSGDIVIALVNGSDAVCKRLKKYSDGIMLLSTNPTYDPMVFNHVEIDRKPVRIIGKVVELRAKF